MVNKHIYSTRIYISLLINISVSPNGQWGTTTHDIPPLREGRKLDILGNINYSAHKTETCQGNAISEISSDKVLSLLRGIYQSRIRC